MADIVAKIGVSVFKKLVTERFLSRVMVAMLRALAKSTDNTLDDEVVASVAEALGEA